MANELNMMAAPNRAAADHFSLGCALTNPAVVIGSAGIPVTLSAAPLASSDAFRLEATSSAIEVQAGGMPGFQYAGSELGQWLRQTKDKTPHLQRESSPVFAKRGIMLDISRNKVPSMATLFSLVDQLAAWKINHLQLYTEHTFAYARHEAVWREASPMTADEIRALDAYCAERNIELAANQNSLGHLHRWLKLPAYRHLAECPDGYMTPWGEQRTGPFSLNPEDPASQELLKGWYDELLPNFSSPLFNVGCDEAFDLGQGKSRAACETKGKGQVYLNYLMAVKRLVESHGKTMMFWGDIILNHPDLIPELEKDAIALVWGYEADHPFPEQCRRFAEAGVPFWVCPGTSNWNSITGRFDNARQNIQLAVEAGISNGAPGFLLTEWGDHGHWQTFPFTLLALAMGSHAAWSGRLPDENELAQRVPEASALIELGRIYLDAGFALANTSPVFPLLRFTDPAKTLDQWTLENLRRADEHVIKALAMLRVAKDLPAPWNEEIQLAAAMLRHALHRGRWLKSGKPGPAKKQLLEEINLIKPEFIRLWMSRNRPGGLPESLEPLELRAQEYA